MPNRCGRASASHSRKNLKRNLQADHQRSILFFLLFYVNTVQAVFGLTQPPFFCVQYRIVVTATHKNRLQDRNEVSTKFHVQPVFQKRAQKTNIY